jgi:hypothetical protein
MWHSVKGSFQKRDAFQLGTAVGGSVTQQRPFFMTLGKDCTFSPWLQLAYRWKVKALCRCGGRGWIWATHGDHAAH